MAYEVSLFCLSLFILFAPGMLYVLLSRRKSTIRHIPGPPSPSWIFGNMKQIILAHNQGDHEFKWQKTYGPVYRIKGCFGQDHLMVADPLTLQYILANSSIFPLTPALLNVVDFIYGNRSFLSSGVDANTHKNLRTAFNAGFSAAAVRTYEPVIEGAAQMISQKLEELSTPSVDICGVLGVAVLDMISQAVLGCTTTQLGSELTTYNLKILPAAMPPSTTQILYEGIGMLIPMWLFKVATTHLPTKLFKMVRRANQIAFQIGRNVVREKKKGMEIGLDVDTDVIGTLLQSDKTKEAVSEDEIVAQIPLLLSAGQDTTTNTLAFGLLQLAKNTRLQDELRAEIHAFVGPVPRNYDSLPLLNAFIKENLRVYPPEWLGPHEVTEATVIPLSQSITTITGETIAQLPVQKGQHISIAIGAYHRLESRWGEDADVFRPSRWLDDTVHKGNAIGPYANLLTFLGGPHTCPGWRFAILAMQVFLYEMVGKFSFSLPKDDPVRVGLAGTIFPMRSDGKKGAPICVKRLS